MVKTKGTKNIQRCLQTSQHRMIAPVASSVIYCLSPLPWVTFREWDFGIFPGNGSLLIHLYINFFYVEIHTIKRTNLSVQIGEF